MGIDISDLGLVEPDTLEWDTYEEGGSGKPLPPKGEYWLQAPAAFTKESFRKGNSNQLIATVNSVIAEGPHAGFDLRYQEVSAKKYSNRNASQAGDYIKSCGLIAQPNSNAEYVAAIVATAARRYRARLDWEAYDKDTKFTVKGYDKFPDDGQGGKLPYVEHPTRKDEAGKPIRMPARIRVASYLPAKS